MMRRSPQKKYAGLVGWLLLSLMTGSLGAIASVNAKQFYSQLTQPSWAPPSWVFAPVWSILYVMMGLAAWLVWQSNSLGKTRFALTLYMLQLALNALWSWIFFAWHQGALAFAEILVLWVLIAAVIVAFWRMSVLAAALMFPYLLWVTFATALTFAIWRLNAGVL
jgi:benzodiazapine receptor